MKNLFIIPTDKPSEFYSIDGKHKLANSTMAMDWYISSVGYKPHNIYITNDEEIKEGDWVLFMFDEVTEIVKVTTIVNNAFDSKEGFGYGLEYSKKIILTTDQELIKDGVQAIDDDFLEWFVKNPSCEEVGIEKDYNYGNLEHFDYRIIIPKEELGGIPKGSINMVIGKSKQETLEEAAEKYSKQFYYAEDSDAYSDFIQGAKWNQERSYSEEEVLDILVKAIKDVKVKRLTFYDGGSEYPIYSNLSKWFEKYKKK